MDPAKALMWFRKAADQDHPYAQLHLGYMYEAGKGVRQDEKEAEKWWRMAVAGFRKAAKKGNPQKQINLGLMHANGRGVETNLIAAYAWYNIAAANGNANAKKGKGFIVKEMTAEDISKAQALSKEMLKKNPKLLK